MIKSSTYVLSLVFILGCSQQPAENQTDAGSSSQEDDITSPMETLPGNEAGNVVARSIEQAGGWDAWQAVNTLSYEKIIQYYDSTSSLEREIRQLHQYQMQPTFKANISWHEDDNHFVIINNGKQAWKYKNGEELTDQASQNSAWNSSFGSHYVMCMPFKLTDPGTVLTYEGIDTLSGGQVVHSVKTTYKEEVGSSAVYHTWWYYFDKNSYEPAANFLDYGDGFSYTAYADFTTLDGLKINKQRKGYRTDSTRMLQFVRTIYTNENIQLNVELDSTLFEQKN